MAADFAKKYGKWALITGATSGIGAALAEQIAAKGVNIVLVARKEAELRERATLLKAKHGVETHFVSADLATYEGVEAVRQTDKEIGLLVVAAGLEVNGAIEKTSVDREAMMLQLNVIATFQLVHHFAKGMVQRGRGGILMVSSLSGHMPNPYFSNYAATKSYVLNFGASLYGELRGKGIDVTVLSPGLTNTPMAAGTGMDWTKTPMKPMEPSVVARVALNGLGTRVVSVPGARNKIMAWAAKFSPAKMAAIMSEKMVRNAIDRSRI